MFWVRWLLWSWWQLKRVAANRRGWGLTENLERVLCAPWGLQWSSKGSSAGKRAVYRARSLRLDHSDPYQTLLILDLLFTAKGQGTHSGLHIDRESRSPPSGFPLPSLKLRRRRSSLWSLPCILASRGLRGKEIIATSTSAPAQPLCLKTFLVSYSRGPFHLMGIPTPTETTHRSVATQWKRGQAE